MVTWNVATAEPPDDITSLLHLNSQKKADLYVIGLQEVRAAPLKFVTDLAFGDSWSCLFMNTLTSLGYIKVSSVRMQGLLLLLFSKLEHVPFLRDIRTTYTRTGIYGYWGNKGGVSIRFSLYGHSVCFLNCHLAAHIHNSTERVEEFEHILNSQTFEGNTTLSVLDHKLVFWFGDLNFRIEDHGMHFIRNCINSKNFNLLWSKDQLTMMKKKIPRLQQFEEGPLDFQPTYKFDLNSNEYDSSGKKRKPAWCDRILWRINPKPPPENVDKEHHDDGDEDQKQLEDPLDEFPLSVIQDTYTSNMEYSVSDHKPVTGIFTLELRKMYKTPLVEVCAEGEWSADLDALVTYRTLEQFPSSAWDWIGLYKRLKDIKFWKQELEQKLQEIVQEIDLLLTIKNRVEKALGCCAEPLQATLDCLNERQSRVQIDLVYDDVEKELLKEKDVIEGVTALLRRILEQIVEQIRLNRSAKYFLEKDLRDKFQAQNIDDFCFLLSSTTATAEMQAGARQSPNEGVAVTPQEWETFSSVNIDKAEKERNNSASLRMLVENLLAQMTADVRKQHQATNSALILHIQETRSAKTRLEDQLNKLLAEIASQEQNLDALKVAVVDKEGPLSVAQTRLTARQQRPNMELCNDRAQSRLLAEVQQLTSTKSRLKESSAESEMELRALTKNQLLLEEEIQVKTNSLYIDEVICTQLLQSITIHDF
ncbi:Inositol polyphosphate 5-phosphatase K [Bagarius yarrelli]|uniref:phosphoinositide 5-phosphatase n=1 Tax=Bagarius yarrelli TaxID=175774 RepID=A0A556TRS3_BAGYA|nr:Inositol polyphosphate 5-phosphatase K [Bagarius yarrelli]